MDETESTKFITERMMQEFESIRASGVANMMDYYKVMRVARKHGAKQLAGLSQGQYMVLLNNYQKMMDKFKIESMSRSKVRQR